MGQERDLSEREQGQPDEMLGSPHPVEPEGWDVHLTESMTPTEALAFVVDLVDDSASVSLDKVFEPGGFWPVGWVASYRRDDVSIEVSGPDQQTAVASLRYAVGQHLLERALASIPDATDIDPDSDHQSGAISFRVPDGESWVVALEKRPDEEALSRPLCESLSVSYPGSVVVVLPIDRRLLDTDTTIEAILQQARGRSDSAEQDRDGGDSARG